ncbi:hypothetical protein [Planctomyces sp. SH-PL62]|uniref:hypothetical protein n=1 Tax=Planctomyces sp. SH-PL62 TaxID=1636152 RepID=UPI00078D2104|nr:hypothetical protein [Planctomyces sp. SH-PL62]AMV40528.1 hypothetical protein VT85_24070 [Planctomyces sp. SH-PL62]
MLRLNALRASSSFRASTFLIALVAAGCGGQEGPPREPVEGVVTLDGEPLEKGLITFTPAAGGELVVSGLIVDGTFALPREEGPGLGPHRVDVWSKKATGKTLKDADDPENLVEERVEVIPARYNLKSELRAEVVQGGGNQFTYELTGSRATPKKVASSRP